MRIGMKFPRAPQTRIEVIGSSQFTYAVPEREIILRIAALKAEPNIPASPELASRVM
jgi:hypothetical protein